jgi:O-antigen ligase
MEVLKRNSQFIFIVFLWLLSGYGGPLPYLVVPITVIVMKRRNMYQELLLGFFLILTLSDSRSYFLDWASNAKNEYIVLMAIFLMIDRKSFSHFSYFYKRFIPFFLIAFLCVFFAPSDILFVSFQKTLSYFFLILVVSNYTIKCHNDYGGEFYKNLMYLSAVILAAGFLLRVINPEEAYLDARYRGILGNPNGLGIYVMMIFIVFALIREKFPTLFSARERNIILALMLVSTFMAGSRNSIFAMVLFIFFSYFYKISPFLGFILFLVFIVGYLSVLDNVADIVNYFGLGDYLRVNTLQDASGRYIAWNFAKDHIRESIWLGRGFEYTENLFEEYSDWLNNLGHQGNAHNTYLTLWLDTGLIGLVAYVWAMGRSFAEAAKSSKLAIPAMYSILFSTVFESWMAASLNPFTIQLFIILTMLTSESISQYKAPAVVPLQ